MPYNCGLNPFNPCQSPDFLIKKSQFFPSRNPWHPIKMFQKKKYRPWLPKKASMRMVSVKLRWSSRRVEARHWADLGQWTGWLETNPAMSFGMGMYGNIYVHQRISHFWQGIWLIGSKYVWDPLGSQDLFKSPCWIQGFQNERSFWLVL